MIVTLLQLFWVYFHVGLLGFGGGYVLISMIQYEVVQRYGWITEAQFTDIVAISQMTPGPIGINSATYIGYTSLESHGHLAGILGSVVATTAVCLPSFVLVLIVCYLFNRFHNSPYMQDLFNRLFPVTIGMIGSVVIMLITPSTFIDYWSYILFAAAVVISYYYRIHPITMIVAASICGIIIYGLLPQLGL